MLGISHRYAVFTIFTPVLFVMLNDMSRARYLVIGSESGVIVFELDSSQHGMLPRARIAGPGQYTLLFNALRWVVKTWKQKWNHSLRKSGVSSQGWRGSG